jgi:hypothetical protein
MGFVGSIESIFMFKSNLFSIEEIINLGNKSLTMGIIFYLFDDTLLCMNHKDNFYIIQNAEIQIRQQTRRRKLR